MQVLFVCVANSCRSQIAEGIAKKMGLNAHSAGTNPSQKVNPNAIKILREMDINTSKLFPKSIDEFYDEDFDIIISMGCGVSCPSIRIDQDWNLDDPVGKDLKFFEETAKKIKQNIIKLIKISNENLSE